MNQNHYIAIAAGLGLVTGIVGGTALVRRFRAKRAQKKFAEHLADTLLKPENETVLDLIVGSGEEQPAAVTA